MTLLAASRVERRVESLQRPESLLASALALESELESSELQSPAASLPEWPEWPG